VRLTFLQRGGFVSASCCCGDQTQRPCPGHPAAPPWIRELGQRSVMIIGRVHTERATWDAASTALAVLECRDRTSLASYQCLAV
jgi:hypothetical protein